MLLDAADDPARAVGDLAVTTAADRSLLDTWADGPSPRGTPSPAHLAVARSARSAPDLTAVVHGRDHLTYAQLEAESDALAAHLLTVAHPGDRVGVLLERTVRLPIAVLAVLKAGCCCVPLDPAYPAERITFMLRDSRCGAVLTSSRLQHHITRLPDVPPLLLDEHRPTAPGPRPGLPDVHPEDPAYLLYTSGSTGRPKGVVMPHRSLANLVQWQSLRSARGATTAQFAPLSFDVAFQELFSTWAARGTLVLVDNEVRRDPARLLALIRTAAVERLFLPYVALQQIAEYAAADDWHGPSLREVICAGEQLFVTPAIRDFFTHRTSASLENQYGPTETHVVTAERLSGDPSAWRTARASAARCPELESVSSTTGSGSFPPERWARSASGEKASRPVTWHVPTHHANGSSKTPTIPAPAACTAVATWGGSGPTARSHSRDDETDK
ncbi:AMP-binding protein [Streptomyces sp. B21-102]